MAYADKQIAKVFRFSNLVDSDRRLRLHIYNHLRSKLMRCLIACLCFATMGVATMAQATPFPASLLPDASTSLSVQVSLNGSDLGTGPLVPSGGSVSMDVNQTGTAPPPLDLSNIGGTITVQDFAIGTLLTATNAALTVGPSAGPYLTGGDNATVDLSNLPLTISSGIVTALGSTVFDFSTAPVVFNLPSPTIAGFTETGGPGSYDLTLSIPVDVAGTADVVLFGSPATIGYHVSGTLVLAGPMAVPEPATWTLAGLGAVCALAVARRRSLCR
jgi:hypothetical protein